MPLLVLLICVLCVVYARHRHMEGDRAVERERMERRADAFAVKLLERLLAYEQVLRGAAGVFAATPTVTRESWRRYVTRQELERTYPGILAIGYAPRVTAANLESHQTRVRGEGFPDYVVRPRNSESDAFPIEFVEPFTGRNLRAFGYDMFSEQTRREAMSRARDSGAPALSGRVTLLQDDTGQKIPGFLLYVPIYHGGETPLTLTERRQHLSGFVYSAYFATELFSRLVDWDEDGVVVSVHDGQPGAAGFLYTSATGPSPTAADQEGRVELLRVIEAGGRHLTIQLRGLSTTDPIRWWAAMEVWLGLAASLLLSGVVLLATQTRQRAEAIAEERTEELQRRTDELESSRNLLDAVIQSVPVVVSVKDKDFRIALINSESERFHGVKDSDYLGKSDYELFPLEQADRIRAQDLAILASGEPLTIEEPFVSASGAHRWVIKRKVVVPLPDGGRGVMTTLFDITDRRRSEVAVRESEARWSSVFETAGEGILVIDERGLVDSANGAACSIFGYERSDIIGTDARRLLSESDRAILDAPRGDSGVRSRVTGLRRGGGSVALEWSLREFRLGDRSMRTAIVSDLTVLVRQQAISRRTEEVANVGGWELDFATGRVYWTEQTYRIHGVPIDEPEPPLADAIAFYAPEARPVVEAAVARSIARGEPWDFTVQLMPRGGGRTWVRSVGHVDLRDGRPIRAYGAFQDVTRIKEAEDEIRRHRDTLQETVEARTTELRTAMEAAERANRAKSDFLANMSHELRTPMHAVLSFAKLGGAKASADTSEGSASRRYFGRILESGERLLRLVDDLLDLSKMEAGRMNYDFGAHDLAKVASEVVAELEEMAQTRGVQLKCFAPGDQFLARIDRHRMGQVLRNLLSNALRYTPAGKSVRVEIESVTMPAVGRREGTLGPCRVLRVVDEGVGIPQGELESIFEKFVQSSKTKSGAGGTGLGLPICREIVQAHGGDIFASHAVGGGAVLTVVLPTMVAAERAGSTEASLAEGATA